MSGGGLCGGRMSTTSDVSKDKCRDAEVRWERLECREWMKKKRKETARWAVILYLCLARHPSSSPARTRFPRTVSTSTPCQALLTSFFRPNPLEASSFPSALVYGAGPDPTCLDPLGHLTRSTVPAAHQRGPFPHTVNHPRSQTAAAHSCMLLHVSLFDGPE